ncbi:MAG: hypothetical protein GX121_01735 [Ignavibacteria bacterium]|nr:hypothetical protein [Ignavibacteria bacterium]
MLLVIPSLYLSQGVCCDCIKGEHGTEEFYQNLANNIIALAKLLRNENSKSIYIIDSDSFKGENNQLNVNSICFISQTIDIPIQVFSKFKSREECEILLKGGVQRIVIDKPLVERITNIDDLIKQYSPTRVAFNFNQKELADNDDSSLKDYMQYISGLGANRLIFTFSSNNDIKNTNNNNIETQLKELNSLALEFNMKISLKNAVVSSTQLIDLSKREHKAIDSLIIGEQLFENKFPCQKIWREVEQIVDASEK